MRFKIIVILCQGDKVIYVVRKTLSIDIKEKKLDMKAEILKKDDLFLFNSGFRLTKEKFVT